MPDLEDLQYVFPLMWDPLLPEAKKKKKNYEGDNYLKVKAKYSFMTFCNTPRLS